MDSLRQMLVFSVGDHQYAMDILNLREVGRMPQLEAEPGAPPGVLGIARLHGEPVRVRELATRLGDSGDAPSPHASAHSGSHGSGSHGSSVHPVGAHRPWLIVSRGRSGDDHWLVDAVQDIVEYDPTQVRPTDEDDPDRRIAGLIEVGGRLTYLLTPELLTGSGRP